jgi:Alginate export
MRTVCRYQWLAKRAFAVMLLTVMACASPAFAQNTGDDNLILKLSDSWGNALTNTLTNGRLLLDLRPRYNFIEETNKREAADAWTARVLLGWQTAPLFDTRLTAQWIVADHIGNKRFNDEPARIPNSPYPLLPDPRHHGVNQLFADYTGISDTRVKLGRQLVRMGNQRFVSDNDFRQIPQVFDGVTLANTALPNSEIQVGEYRRVRTTLGRTNALRLHLLHAAWNSLPEQVLAAYAIGHDQAATGAQTGFANNANRVVGIRSEGSIAIDESSRLLYHAEFAQQKRFRGGDARIDADYWRVGAGWTTPRLSVRIDHENKGSNGGRYAFQTPLTDFYAFNGLALQYTSTPAQGLRDTWITLRTQIARLDLFTEIHRFRADVPGGGVGRDLGREWDLTLSYPLMANLSARLQLARFRAGAGARVQNDVDKTWLALNYSY